MKHLLPIIIFSMIACNDKPNLEGQVKLYMKDSVVPRFNDPSSYQFVSMKIDTFKGGDYLKNLKDLYADTTILSKEVIDDKKKEITKLSGMPGYTDSILNLEIHVEYRGKNKMGALILDKTNLRYFPKDNKITEVQ